MVRQSVQVRGPVDVCMESHNENCPGTESTCSKNKPWEGRNLYLRRESCSELCPSHYLSSNISPTHLAAVDSVSVV